MLKRLLIAVLLGGVCLGHARAQDQGGPVIFPQLGHSGTVDCLAFSRDGRVLASGSGDNTVRLWDVAGGHELRTLSGHTRPVTSLAFSPDGKMLASSSNDYTFKLWDVTTGRERISVHEDAPVFVAFSPDGKVLAGRFDDGYYRLTCR